MVPHEHIGLGCGDGFMAGSNGNVCYSRWPLNFSFTPQQRVGEPDQTETKNGRETDENAAGIGTRPLVHGCVAACVRPSPPQRGVTTAYKVDAGDENRKCIETRLRGDHDRHYEPLPERIDEEGDSTACSLTCMT